MADAPVYTPLHTRIHVRHDIHVCDVIGDVHGCYEELVLLLERLGHEDMLDPEIAPIAPGETPRVIFVGDIVDRGDKIVESLRLVQRLCAQGHALMVIGNHDDRFLRWLRGDDVKLEHGLPESVEQFQAIPARSRERWSLELQKFLSELPWAIRIDDGRAIVVHAAWHAELHTEESAGRIRRYTMYGPVTGERTPEGHPERLNWAPLYSGPELVIFGHQIYDEPYRQEHAIGIDTGCVYGGELTALHYPSLDTVSVKSIGVPYK